MTWGFQTIGASLGLLFTAAYFALGLARAKPTDLGSIIGVFLGVYASVAAIEIIPVALEGDASRLPSLWPVYVILGIIAIFYVSLEHVYSVFRELFRKSAQTSTAEPASKKNEANPPDA